MTLIALPQHEWPPSTPWLTEENSTLLHRRIVWRARHDDGIQEEDGPNRSPYLDALCDWAGSPRGSYWCGIWAGRVFVDAGALVPRVFADCDRWLPYLTVIESVPPALRPGCAILYGQRGTGPVEADYRAMLATGWNAQHIGIVVKWPTRAPLVPLSTEGNRGYAGSMTNNGLAVDTAPITRKDVLGLIMPKAAA